MPPKHNTKAQHKAQKNHNTKPKKTTTQSQKKPQHKAPKNHNTKVSLKSLWSRSAEREIPMLQALRRGESKNSPVDCFLRGDALRKRASPCSRSRKLRPHRRKAVKELKLMAAPLHHRIFVWKINKTEQNKKDTTAFYGHRVFFYSFIKRNATDQDCELCALAEASPTGRSMLAESPATVVGSLPSHFSI